MNHPRTAPQPAAPTEQPPRRLGRTPQSRVQPRVQPPAPTLTARARRLLALLLLLLAPPLLAAEPAGPNTPALHALLEGRVEDAQSLLHATLAQNPSDASAHQLLCRVFYAQEQADRAIRECELAAAATPRADAPHASNAQLWLGRAYGLKARHASPLAAFSLARKVHAAFEAAVQINPLNIDALSDLGEYFVDAPTIVGGGDDKARALAARMLPRFPQDAHRLLAQLALSNKDAAHAESEFKLAISAARPAEGHTLAEAQAGGWIDLARFLETRHRPDDADAALHTALALDRSIPPERAHGPLLVDAASILTALHREPALAERCLRDYLAGHNLSDAAPAFKVHLQLSRLLAARGDSAEASREASTAAALAPAFNHTAPSAQGL
ncbi:MAG: tetratricopeptide repeat protein [Acidobacteriota bacterium]|nr:tetratricopeptide repeat protein [Acidobacteriota bacterium]